MKSTKELFDTTVPAIITAHQAEMKAIGSRFQVNIEGAGNWHINLTNSGPTCVPGSEKADLTINMKDKDFQEFIKNPQKLAMSFFFSGKLKTQGNVGLASKLNKVLEYVK